MFRKIVLFLALVLVSLTAGRAFWAWLGDNPAHFSGAVYVAYFQALDKAIAVPIAVTGLGGVVLSGLAAVLYRRDQLMAGLLLGACLCAVASSAVTILVNVPINERIATWNPADLPGDYADFLSRWWQWHKVRAIVSLVGTALLFASAVLRLAPRGKA